MSIKIAPSILAADYANLQNELQRINNSDMIHIDVMDGHFVPNISIGPPVIKSIKKICKIPFDVHLMISDPIKYIDSFCDAGADIITIHEECNSDIEKTIDKIVSRGVKASLSVKPGTPVEKVFPYIDRLSMVLVMTVEPGFGGQGFMPGMLPKIRKIREKNKDIDIEVDGGINADTARECANAGANVLVAGSAVFKSGCPSKMIDLIKNNAEEVFNEA